jgi:hypothetical protein
LPSDFKSSVNNGRYYCPYKGCDNHKYSKFKGWGPLDSGKAPKTATEHWKSCSHALDRPRKEITDPRSNIPVVEMTFGLYPSGKDDSVIGVHSLRHLMAITMAPNTEPADNLLVTERGWAVKASELRACIAHLRNDGADDAGDEQVGGAADDAEGS